MSNEAMVKEIVGAIGAHGAWKLKLRVAITRGESDVLPEKVKCDDRCPFGRWIHGPTIDAETKAGMPYQVVRRLHREFHETAASVLDLAIRSRKEQADALFAGEFTQRSEKLVRALSKWKGELS
ncbi:CZB domain-containing protein [Sphingobium subterraneum]|uniref:Chemoreceptor zinc-binding domain-containing protein n=1 Tax=Sphingobium subterraneum TaxID=627688 RepID=A0A841J5M4_9SPHN|nr:CZB domain-containing protein [Sphingobium subterraneum]MBB6123521.1 hypothetical protein [Sphingobium subterraneum]